MNKLCCLIVFFLACKICEGQNLVQNESFEDTIKCSNYNGPPKLPCRPWFTPTDGSPDYCSSVYDPSCGFTGVPNNGAFGYQFPKTGNAMCGFVVYVMWGTQGTLREYIESRLSDSLLSGHKYCLQFYVNLANNSNNAIDRIGAYFSADSVKQDNFHATLPLVPQIESQAGVFLSDTLSWTLISGEYIAQGGEKYITIGNFHDDNNTDTLPMSGGLPWVGSYYFIDDVSLSDCTVGIEELQNSSVYLNPNPFTDKLNITEKRNELFEVNLYDVTARKIFNQSFTNSISINTEQLAKGVYFYEMKSKNGVVNKGKVVKD